jgi:hypothetical protein
VKLIQDFVADDCRNMAFKQLGLILSPVEGSIGRWLPPRRYEARWCCHGKLAFAEREAKIRLEFRPLSPPNEQARFCTMRRLRVFLKGLDLGGFRALRIMQVV